MAKPLHERITSARTTDRVTITDLEALLLEVAAERDRFSGIFDQATADSIRFELSEEDRDEAANAADRAKRNYLAMSGAFDELSAKRTAKRSSDEQQAKRAARDAIIAERDALADLLSREWPALEALMVVLLHAVKENDAKMAASRIFEASAESVARGLTGNFYSSSGAVRRLTDAKLPSFANAHHLAWPSPKRLNLDAARDEMVRAKQRMYAEDASWVRYVVTPPLNNREAIPLMMRNGPGFVSETPVIGRMTEDGVKDARNNGCTVSPANSSASVGLPAAAFMS